MSDGLTKDRALVLERMLSDDLYWSPYRFALWAYPWGEGELKRFDGPRVWQRGVMEEMEQYLRDAYRDSKTGLGWGDFFRKAVASGRGPGKSALLGMLAHWFASTRIGSSVWVAANGEPQLRTKTFPEIAKWVAMGINKDFFEINAMSIKPSKWFAEHIKSPQGLGKSTEYYYIMGQLWSAENPEAFAGAHNWDGEMSIFDEASGIPNDIWGVQEGVFTEDIPDRFWFAFSNPRRNTGEFFNCFNRPGSKWRTLHVNSMDVEGINTSTFQNIVDKNGADSDSARIEVFGLFPRAGDKQFISTQVVMEAQRREVITDAGSPLVMGVDVARGSTDYCVARFRQGKDARSIPPVRWQAKDFNESARKVAWLMDKYNPDGVFIDQGMGSAVVDILKTMRYKTTEIAFGAASSRPEYAYKRTEMYADLRDWLGGGGAIDSCPRLYSDLTEVEFKEHGPAKDKIILEPKDDLRARLGRSPDDGDALVLTFARAVARKDRASYNRQTMCRDVDYAIFG